MYEKESLIWSALLMFVMGLGSRRQFDHEAEADECGTLLANLNRLAGTQAEDIPHNQTAARYLCALPPEELELIPTRMVQRLVRMRALEFARLFGLYLIAIDATGTGSSGKPCCNNCLRQEQDGKTIYYHMVLEAKLVTPGGLAFSVASEFIENADPKDTRQDCERKAVVRLMKKLKERLPRLPVCLLLDALHANQTVFDLCKEYKWEWIATFKEGGLPTAWDEFCRLKALSPENFLENRVDGRCQRLSWVADLEHAGHRFWGFDCLTYNQDCEVQYFAWCSSMRADKKTVAVLANKGGRTRWTIENQGFNNQKNHGYDLEHVYSKDENGRKNYYLLLQIAHILMQLLVKGLLAPAFKSVIRTFKNLFRRVSRHLLSYLIPADAVAPDMAAAIQIRLDSS